MSTIISARLLAKRARSAANLAARFQAEGRIAAAERCATFAQDRVAEIRAINPAKFDADPGIVPAFADGRKGAITRKGDNTQYN